MKIYKNFVFRGDERKTDWSTRRGMKISLTCKKCGYHKSFWKL